jgi:hypothetical protein
MSHTQGKLVLAEHTDDRCAIRSETPVAPGMLGKIVADVGYSGSDDKDAANARRLVACWNAAIGIPTEELEAAADGRLLNIFEGLISERDELLEALKVAHSHLDMARLVVSHCKDAELIYSAIERAEKGGA